MSQEELALAVGYKTKASINKIEKNLSAVPHDKLIKIASALRVPVDNLVGGENYTPKSELVNQNGVKLSHREKQPWIEAGKAKRVDNEWYADDVYEYATTSTSKTAQALRNHLIGALKALNIEASADTTLVPKFNALSSANQQVVMTLVNSLLQQQGTVLQTQNAPSDEGESVLDTQKGTSSLQQCLDVQK
jgi:transcriptional regulator with XRE-family HTH domain